MYIKRLFFSGNWSRRTMISLKPGGLATRNRIGAAKPVNRPQDLRYWVYTVQHIESMDYMKFVMS